MSCACRRLDNLLTSCSRVNWHAGAPLAQLAYLLEATSPERPARVTSTTLQSTVIKAD